MSEVVVGTYDDDESGIVPVGGIDKFNDFDPNGFFDGEVNSQTARMAVAELKSLEEMLKAVDQFGRYACEFALKEAYTYIEISKYEGAEEKLTATQKDTVNWIRNLTEEELAQVLEEVGQGTRIRSIINRERKEHAKDIKANAADKEYKRISDSIVNKLLTTGHTTLTPSAFIEQWQSIGEPDAHTIRAYTESTRDRILKKKGRGLGDSRGTYMLVEKCSRNDAAQIIKTRLESIVADLKVIKEICDETHFVIPSKGVETIVDLIKSLRDSNNILELSL